MAISLERFQDMVALSAKFDGMLMPLDLALFCCFLQQQADAGVAGDIAEFGVYRGKSAAVFLSFLRPDETLKTVEYIQSYPEIDNLKAICDRLTFYWGKSEDAVVDPAFIASFGSDIRFSHHDASHSFENVTAEVGFMENRLTPRGIVVLDDFCNQHYSQVASGFYQNKIRNNSDLEIFLISSNKAWVCKRADFAYYEEMVLSRLLSDLRGMGVNAQLSRTDAVPDHRAFFISLKSAASDPDLFGGGEGEIYAALYQPTAG